MTVSIQYVITLVVNLQRTYIGHTAAAIKVVNYDSRSGIYIYKDTLRAGHTALVTAAVEVTYKTVLQMPGGTYLHIGLVVTAKQTSNLELITAGLGVTGVDTHCLEAPGGEQLTLAACIGAGGYQVLLFIYPRVFYAVDYCAGVIKTDNRRLCYCSCITAAKCVYY